MKLEEFATDFLENILAETEASAEGDQPEFQENVFTRNVLDYLVSVGESVDPEVAYFHDRGSKVNGFDVHDDVDAVDLFVAVFDSAKPVYKVSRGDVSDALGHARKFLEKALAGVWKQMEESHAAFGIAQRIHASASTLKSARVYLLTNGLVAPEASKNVDVKGVRVSHHVWDIERLFQVFGGKAGRELIEIDGEALGGGLPCVRTPSGNPVYDAYIGIIPGNVLAALYGRWGQRLLERNVRSFLQTTGAVNKGIQKTLIDTPDMFLAYNNGISTTADAVETTKGKDGQLLITRIHNLQIVNGAQTTASLYEAAKRHGADLSKVSVQAKLTVLKDPVTIDQHVPLISRYANSQSKINLSDFSANHPYHVQLEKLSRNTWVPNPDERGKATTKWYYERARGQYLNDLHAADTPAKKRAFKILFPSSQKLTKPLVAKYEMCWIQAPHIVSLGAEKNFSRFMTIVAQNTNLVPDERYFRHLVAKAVLFKETDGLVQKANFGGYKANIVAYSVAWLSFLTGQMVDLEGIWERQAIGNRVKALLTTIIGRVHTHITSPPTAGMNITEWCKKEQCWTSLKGVRLNVDALGDEALEMPSGGGPEPLPATLAPQSASPEDEKNIAAILARDPEEWFRLAAWAKRTDNLAGWERGLAFSLGRVVGKKARPSVKQALHGVRIMKEAEEKGFRADRE